MQWLVILIDAMAAILIAIITEKDKKSQPRNLPKIHAKSDRK